MGESLKFDRYVRTPFQVEAVRITEENLHEIAALIGEITTEDGKTFITINRKIIPTMGKAFPGWYLTRSGDSLRCYSAKVFKQQFIGLGEGATGFEDLDDRVTWSFPSDTSKRPKRVFGDGMVPPDIPAKPVAIHATVIANDESGITTQNTLEVSEDCPPPLPEVSEECAPPPPVNPPTPGWPSDPDAQNIVTPNDIRQENNIVTLDDGHRNVNLSVGDMAQYDPKTD